MSIPPSGVLTPWLLTLGAGLSLRGLLHGLWNKKTFENLREGPFSPGLAARGPVLG
jgi:hypothetical protein